MPRAVGEGKRKNQKRDFGEEIGEEITKYLQRIEKNLLTFEFISCIILYICIFAGGRL